MTDEQEKNLPEKKAPKNKKKRKKKAVAILVAPFLVAMAPSVPPAAAQIVKVVVDAQNSDSKPQFPGTDGYIFAHDWAQFAEDAVSRRSAIELATRVVDQAFTWSLSRQTDESVAKADRRPLVQWILAGGMTHAEAQRCVSNVGQLPEVFFALVREIRKLGTYGLAYPSPESKVFGKSQPPRRIGRPIVVINAETPEADDNEPPTLKWLSTEGGDVLRDEPDSEDEIEVVSPPDVPEG